MVLRWFIQRNKKQFVTSIRKEEECKSGDRREVSVGGASVDWEYSRLSSVMYVVVEVCGGVGSGLRSEGIIYAKDIDFIFLRTFLLDSKSKCNATRHEWCTIETAEMII